MAIKFNELMKNYEKFFDEISTLKNKELVEFDRYLYLFDKLVDTDSSFAKLYHKIDDEVASLDSDKKILAFMFALDELGHIDVSHATFNESKKSARRSLKEKGLRYGVDTLELIQDDIEQYIQDNDLDIQIVDSGLAKAMDVMYIYDCKGKGMKKLKSGDLMDYLFSENGMLFHNLDFGVKVSPNQNQITITLPKTQDYVE